MIDRNSPLPIYFQLKQLIKQQIQGGALGAGDRLDTEQELCDRYNISRAPVRQALAELVQEGYVLRRAGLGTFVAGGAPQALAEQIRLQFLANDVRWVSLLDQAVRSWNETHLNQTLRLELTVPPPGLFHRMVQAAAVQGRAPDLISIDYVWLAGYARAGYLVPLDELDGAWVAALRADLEPAVAQNHTLEDHLYGLPFQADATGLWYRKDWLDTEGLVPPQTWDEWLALLDYFAQPETKAHWGNRYPIAFPVGAAAGEATVNLLLPFIWAAGGDLVNEQGQLALDSEPVYRALNFLRQITLERRYLPPETPRFSWASTARAFARGEVPMTLGGTYEWPAIHEECNWEDEGEVARHLKIIPIPRPRAETLPTASLGGTSWGILRQSAHQELTAGLLQLAVSPKVLIPFCQEHLQLAPFRSINRQMGGPKHPWMESVAPLMALARPRPMLDDYVRVSRFLQQMFFRVLWEDAPVQETVLQTVHFLRLLMENAATG